MRSTWICALALVIGCGRLGFQADDGDDQPGDDGRWRTVAVGERTSCGVTVGGELWCWGSGLDGVLGTGATPPTAPPTRVGTDADWSHVTVGTTHACGLRTGGSLWCWGTNVRGALGTLPEGAIAVNPVLVPGASWLAVDAGDASTCGIQTDASLWCWGAGIGQTDTGLLADEPAPARIGTGAWRSISLGATTACAIAADESLWCWGSNERGQVGDGTSGMPRGVPTAVAPGRSWRSVEAAPYHACAIDTTGAGWCWGGNDDGRLGIGSLFESNVPVPIASPPIDAIALGARHTCAIAGEQLTCWGASIRGAIAGVTALSVTTPRAMDGMAAHAVAGGGDTTCVIDVASRLACTGANGHGQAGQEPGAIRALERADDRTDWRAIYAQRNHACGETGDDRVWCWGAGDRGQVGDNTRLDRQAPVEVGTGFTDLAINSLGTGALRGTELWGWGIDVAGAGEFPAPAMFGPGIAGVALGEYHGCALDTAGGVICQGANRYGQLGGGTFDELPVPTMVAGAWRSIEASSVTTCATRTAGGLTDRLFCWGVGFMVGSPTTTDVNAPQPVALPDLEVAQVSIGGDFACALVGAGELWCWGDNSAGQLGVGAPNFSQVPIRVGDRADWIAIETGDQHACAIAADRTLWCWGNAAYGQLGEPLAPRRLPQSIGGAAAWTELALGARFTCALRDDGTRWCAGANAQGELGNGRAWLTELTFVP